MGRHRCDGRVRAARRLQLGACPHAYNITVNGKQQPSLWDDGKLRMAQVAWKAESSSPPGRGVRV